MQRKRKEQNEIEKSYKMDHKVEHLGIPISHCQQPTPLCGAPGTAEMDGWSEELWECVEPADRQLFS